MIASAGSDNCSEVSRRLKVEFHANAVMLQCGVAALFTSGLDGALCRTVRLRRHDMPPTEESLKWTESQPRSPVDRQESEWVARWLIEHSTVRQR